MYHGFPVDNLCIMVFLWTICVSWFSCGQFVHHGFPVDNLCIMVFLWTICASWFSCGQFVYHGFPVVRVNKQVDEHEQRLQVARSEHIKTF